ncbi:MULTISPECIES: hypothetical protein [unclassified Emticicia]|uniref:hypothetical protein n=1 Tax=unclassified Emticicia TaxID=2627301 RepID=UPI000C78758F|nr:MULTISPECIES: hypothetical protein [unclassified Emticicia]PLK46475.1 hypothetical protein C0V77_03800 [Emticicia sp. TH156]UTA68269.1 hypothetical protein MB380_00310 [Emticicia sp. 21SJ11W-3]
MRKAFLTLTLLICAFAAFAQEEEPQQKEKPIFFEQPKPAWKERLRYGGNLWLGFFGAFYIDVSPMVGYELGEKGTVAGLGANLIYQGNFNQNGNLVYGPKLFVRQQVFRSIFIHAEYEMMNAYASQFYSFNPNTPVTDIKKKWEGSPLLGAGFYQGRGGNRGSFISLMYNLGYPNRGFISPQGLGGNNSPIVVRFGFLL